MTWTYLSYALSEETPLYGCRGEIHLEKTSAMKKGDSANSHAIKIPAHTGTHIDAPLHFDDEGKALNDFEADFWISKKTHLLDFKVDLAELISLERIGEQLEQVPEDCEFLFLRSGAGAWRKSDPEVYSKKGPGVGIDVAKWLRANRRIKFLGLDFISLSSFQHREVGREAHKELLAMDRSPNPPVLPVEDMSLAELRSAPEEVIVAPLIFENSDGSPVTVLAKIG